MQSPFIFFHGRAWHHLARSVHVRRSGGKLARFTMLAANDLHSPSGTCRLRYLLLHFPRWLTGKARAMNGRDGTLFFSIRVGKLASTEYLSPNERDEPSCWLFVNRVHVRFLLIPQGSSGNFTEVGTKRNPPMLITERSR